MCLRLTCDWLDRLEADLRRMPVLSGQCATTRNLHLGVAADDCKILKYLKRSCTFHNSRTSGSPAAAQRLKAFPMGLLLHRARPCIKRLLTGLRVSSSPNQSEQRHVMPSMASNIRTPRSCPVTPMRTPAHAVPATKERDQTFACPQACAMPRTVTIVGSYI